MLAKQFIEHVADTYELDDVLYIIGKDREWLLSKIQEELLQHRKDFFDGDEYYAEVVDELYRN